MTQGHKRGSPNPLNWVGICISDIPDRPDRLGSLVYVPNLAGVVAWEVSLFESTNATSSTRGSHRFGRSDDWLSRDPTLPRTREAKKRRIRL